MSVALYCTAEELERRLLQHINIQLVTYFSICMQTLTATLVFQARHSRCARGENECLVSLDRISWMSPEYW